MNNLGDYLRELGFLVIITAPPDTYHLLSTYYVPGTVLDELYRSDLILTTDRYYLLYAYKMV